MKHYFISCFIFILLLCGVSCRQQNDDSSGKVVSQSNPKKTPPVVNEDSIRQAELERLLLNRFRCYVVRQSLLDARKLTVKSDCCLCQTAEQEKMVFETAQNIQNLKATTDLERELGALNAQELGVVSDLSDR